MPIYVYKCKPCLENYLGMVDNGQIEPSDETFESNVLYETSHSMNPSATQILEACVCPRCGSNEAERSVYGQSFTTFVRGYGWLDRNGVHRDMHTHTLLNNDPYKPYRQPGEVDHLKDTLSKKGRRNTKPIHFVNKVTDADVKKAVYKNDATS